MASFHFHLYNSTGRTPDEEGRDLPDLEAARAEAIDGIRSLLSEEVRSGKLDIRGRIEIADASERVLAVIPFRDAVEIHQDVEKA